MVGYLIVFVLGSILGSFLNVCIHRLPKAESVIWPSSHCPLCNQRIKPYDNIPFISYILLRGRCRFCKGKISWRYPLVEFITGFFFLLLFLRYGLSYDLFFYLILISALIVASFIDIAERIIPDEISLGGMVLGFILNAVRGISLSPFHLNWKPALDSFLGIIVGGGVIFLTGWIFDFIYFRLLKRPPIQGETESMGFGDVKLLAMIGAFLGWQKALFTFFVAPFFGVVVGLYLLLTKKEHTIPYGPFLSLGAVISLLYFTKIISSLFPYKIL